MELIAERQLFCLRRFDNRNGSKAKQTAIALAVWRGASAQGANHTSFAPIPYLVLKVLILVQGTVYFFAKIPVKWGISGVKAHAIGIARPYTYKNFT